MIARVYINRHKVLANKKAQLNEPTIAIKTYKQVEYVRQIEFTGSTKLIQDFSNPICSGANIWIETDRDSIRIIE